MNNGYAICYKEWILDKDIKNEIQLLLLISNLCAKLGYCYAGNKYFADMFDCTEVSISTKLRKLCDKNYIEINYTKRGCEIVERKIRLKNFLTDDLKKFEPTIKKDFKENNININNIKEKEKEKEKDDDDSYVRVRACACVCVRGLAEKKKGNAVFRHCPCVLSETFALLTFINDYLLLVAILNLELHNASHWHIVWDERHQLCNYLVHVTETDVLHFA